MGEPEQGLMGYLRAGSHTWGPRCFLLPFDDPGARPPFVAVASYGPSRVHGSGQSTVREHRDQRCAVRSSDHRISVGKGSGSRDGESGRGATRGNTTQCSDGVSLVLDENAEPGRIPRIIARTGVGSGPPDMAAFHRHLLAFLVPVEDHHVVIWSLQQIPWKLPRKKHVGLGVEGERAGSDRRGADLARFADALLCSLCVNVSHGHEMSP